MRYELIETRMPTLLPMTGRSEGVHISQIIHKLAVGLGHYEPREDGAEISDAVRARMELGNTMERAWIDRLKEHWPGRYVVPGELELDGLFGTPDLVDVEDEGVEEFKFTWMSSRNGPDDEKMWKYLVQLKAYCRMMRTGLGRLRVCFVNGTWRWEDKEEGFAPVYRVWEFEFSRRELERNWEMLKGNQDGV